MALNSTLTVLPLPQTAGAFEARALYRAGNFGATVAALRGASSTEAIVLRGRAELRRGELTRALADFETARRATMRQQEAHRERAEVAMLLGTTLARLEREDEAEAAYIDARAYAWSTTDANLHAELEYYLALTAWSRRDLNSAERHIANVMRLGSTAERIRAHELAAYVHGAREAYGAQAAELTKAFELLQGSPDHEVIVEASVLFNLSILAREMYLPGLAARIEERVDNVQWTSDLGRFQYLATMELGWARALAGRRARRVPPVAPHSRFGAQRSLEGALVRRHGNARSEYGRARICPR
jgi:tetratricopeptide (TPR) repeat protein